MTLSAPGCSLENPPGLKVFSHLQHCWVPQTQPRLKSLVLGCLEWSARWAGRSLWKRRASEWLSS